MFLGFYLNEILELLLSNQNTLVCAEQLIHCLDLTLLDEQAPASLLKQLKKKSSNSSFINIPHFQDMALIYL